MIVFLVRTAKVYVGKTSRCLKMGFYSYIILLKKKKRGIIQIKSSHITLTDLTDKMKRSFFQAVVVSILLYGCTTWTQTKWLEKKLDGNYTRML